MSLPVPAITDLLADQRERWERNDFVVVEAYLIQHPGLHKDAEALLDLIYQEVFLRSRRGDKPQRDEYLRRFPHLADAIREQFDVHEAIESDQVPPVPPAPLVEDRPGVRGIAPIPGYEQATEIGRGGVGRVYKAKDSQGRWVALKILGEHHRADQDIRQRFVAEAQTLSALQHPGIVKVLDVNQCAGVPYFVMELIEGLALEVVVKLRSASFAQAVEWLIAVAETMQYVHNKGIIHRDLKPANIMLDGACRPRVMDFGMAKIPRRAGVDGPASTLEGMIIGTPSYMPPEQAGGSTGALGPYSDVYSLGAILYALLTGEPPFDEGGVLDTLYRVRSPEPVIPARQLRPDVPEALDRICLRCLSKRPSDRFQTAQELAEALRTYARHASESGNVHADVSFGLKSLLTGELIPLERESTIVGRSSQCDLALPTPDVSRCHCRIFRKGSDAFVEDLRSTRGIRVNGVKVERTQLKNGDRLEIAKHLFEVVLPASPRMRPPPRP